MNAKIAIELVRLELLKAESRFAPFNSPHEGYAVIREELDELWDEIKANRGHGDDACLKAVQVAAMGLRYLLNLFDDAYAAPLVARRFPYALEEFVAQHFPPPPPYRAGDVDGGPR